MRLSTGMPDLDILLGGEGIPPGSVVLLQGGMGTGKSTLAIQLMARITADQAKQCLYVCVEEAPQTVLRRMDDSYERLDLLRLYADEEYIHPIGLTELRAEGRPDTSHDNDDNGLSFEGNLLTNFLGILKAHPHTRLIVLDSLTAFFSFLTEPQTHLFQDFLFSLRTVIDRNDMILLLIAKQGSPGSHSPILDSQLSMLDSQFTDIVIELEKKEVEVSKGLHEKLHFCQVRKARGTTIQQRSCCYDFVQGKGIRFYPTYGAEGRMSLFWENEPQHDILLNFQHEDVPLLYPRLVVADFNRKGMQRQFAIQRRKTDIPQRKQMMLNNIDEYWVQELKSVADSPQLEWIDPALLQIECLRMGHLEILEELKRKPPLSIEESNENVRLAAIPQIVNFGLMAYRKDRLQEAGVQPPTTWEEMETIWVKLNKPKNFFLIETKTYDSYLATLLEIMWSFGGIFEVTGKTRREKTLRFRYAEYGYDGEKQAIQAMQMVHEWIHKKHLIPHGSTVDAREHPIDWVFARHWYSTLVDSLVTRNPKSGELIPRRGKPEANIGICPLPISFTYQQFQDKHPISRRNRPSDPNRYYASHSCWGEWYLAVEKGSENMSFAHNLISSLMTDRRIVERAMTGAGLPPFEPFYDDLAYGNTMCPCTDYTFGEIRKTFFPDALSRTMIADYPNVARLLDGPFSAITSPKLDETILPDILRRVFQLIKES